MLYKYRKYISISSKFKLFKTKIEKVNYIHSNINIILNIIESVIYVVK